MEAKAKLLYSLPIQKIRNLKDGFSYYQAETVLKDAENEVHIKCAVDILQQCYKM